MQTTYQDLPPELVDHIFRYGCILSTSFCFALSRTSSWTRKLALPYIYSTMIFKTAATARLISENVVEHPDLLPWFLPRNHIRNICTRSVCKHLVDIFHSCNHLSRLAVEERAFHMIANYSSISFSETDSYIPEQAFLCKSDIHLLIFDVMDGYSTFVLPMPGTPISPFNGKITHLRFGQIGSYSEQVGILVHFNRLSHIAIPYHCPEEQHLSDLLRVFDPSSSKISLVVVLLTDKLSEEEHLDALRWVVDMRKTNYRVSAVLSKLKDLQMEWEEEARHGVSIWDKADLFTRSLPSW
jgi:hypothetical protein